MQHAATSRVACGRMENIEAERAHNNPVSGPLLAGAVGDMFMAEMQARLATLKAPVRALSWTARWCTVVAARVSRCCALCCLLQRAVARQMQHVASCCTTQREYCTRTAPDSRQQRRRGCAVVHLCAAAAGSVCTDDDCDGQPRGGRRVRRVLCALPECGGECARSTESSEWPCALYYEVEARIGTAAVVTHCAADSCGRSVHVTALIVHSAVDR
jgi:hypothetical protein